MAGFTSASTLRSLTVSAAFRYLSPSPRRTTHLRAMRSSDSSSVGAPSPMAGTHASACDSSLTLNWSCTDPELVVHGLNEEAYVEVQVGRLTATGRNPVHVDVEDGVVERPHVEPGFFARLAQRDRKGIGVSVAVTPGLEPAPELAMVRKEHAVARHVQDPRRARDVADMAGTVETVGVRVDEVIEARDGRRLLRPSPAVCGEECLQSAAVHWTGRRGAVLALMRIIDHPNREYDGNVRVSGRNCAIDSSPCPVRLGTFVRGFARTDVRCPAAR